MRTLFRAQLLLSDRQITGRSPSGFGGYRAIFLSVVLIFATNPLAFAADAGGNYAIWGVGQSSCHKYVKARANEDARQYRDYLMGYLTAFNTLSEDTYSVSGKTKLGEIEAWLADYCGEHQIESFNRAIQQYAASTFESRLTASPGSSKGWGAKSTK